MLALLLVLPYVALRSRLPSALVLDTVSTPVSLVSCQIAIVQFVQR